MILGLDASTVATGFADGGPQDALPRGGVWRLPGGDDTVFTRTCGMLGQSIIERGKFLKPKAVYLEAPMTHIDRKHSERSAFLLMQITGAVRLACHILGCRLELSAVYDVRKFFIGRGYISREEAKPFVEAKCDDLGWRHKDDNEADAKAVWAYGMAREYPGWRPNAPQLFDQAGGRS